MNNCIVFLHPSVNVFHSECGNICNYIHWTPFTMSGMGLSFSELCCLFCCPPCPSKIAAKLAFLPPEATYSFEDEDATGSKQKLVLYDKAEWQYSEREKVRMHICIIIWKLSYYIILPKNETNSAMSFNNFLFLSNRRRSRFHMLELLEATESLVCSLDVLLMPDLPFYIHTAMLLTWDRCLVFTWG